MCENCLKKDEEILRLKTEYLLVIRTHQFLRNRREDKYSMSLFFLKQKLKQTFTIVRDYIPNDFEMERAIKDICFYRPIEGRVILK